MNIKNKKILAIGPHPDDLELGCFGTLAKLSKENEIILLVLTNGEIKDSNNIREEEAKKSASLINANLVRCNLKDGSIKDDFKHIQIIEKHINEINPDIIFLINGEDSNQDHRYCFNAGITATRKRENIILYNSGSNTSFEPNLFIDITNFIDLKIKAILQHKSQFDESIKEPIKGLAKIYAFKLRKPKRYFEAFKVWRLSL